MTRPEPSAARVRLAIVLRLTIVVELAVVVVILVGHQSWIGAAAIAVAALWPITVLTLLLRWRAKARHERVAPPAAQEPGAPPPSV